MKPVINSIRIGARSSQLSQFQANHVAHTLKQLHKDLQVEIVFITTRGDKDQQTPLPYIGGKGLFTAELEKALYNNEIDIAVHSLKDLPVALSPDFQLPAILERESPLDVLFSRQAYSLRTLPLQASVGTSSVRRSAQLLSVRPDLLLKDIRGNVDTRIQKALNQSLGYDAIIMAHAGLLRLGRLDAITEVLDENLSLPAPGQGALAIQCLSSRPEVYQLCAAINHLPTQIAVSAERAFLAELGGGCSLPVAALGTLNHSTLRLQGRVCDRRGLKIINVCSELDRESHSSLAEDAILLGRQLAQKAIEKGALLLLHEDIG